MVATLSLTIGLHWAVLQSVAWVGMIISYSHDGSFPVAVSKTFDGQHPCKLCKVVQDGKAHEKNHERKAPDSNKKLDSFAAGQSAKLLFPPLLTRSFPRPDAAPQLRADSPPTPPPRFASL